MSLTEVIWAVYVSAWFSYLSNFTLFCFSVNIYYNNVHCIHTNKQIFAFIAMISTESQVSINYRSAYKSTLIFASFSFAVIRFQRFTTVRCDSKFINFFRRCVSSQRRWKNIKVVFPQHLFNIYQLYGGPALCVCAEMRDKRQRVNCNHFLLIAFHHFGLH